MRSNLFPYTTLFRSHSGSRGRSRQDRHWPDPAWAAAWMEDQMAAPPVSVASPVSRSALTLPPSILPLTLCLTKPDPPSPRWHQTTSAQTAAFGYIDHEDQVLDRCGLEEVH